jgi:hypothetical protein
MDTPTILHDEEMFIENFGTMVASSNSYQCARSYFQRGHDLSFIRIGDGTEDTADISLAVGAGTAPVLTALHPGTWYNDVYVTISVGTLGAGYYKITIDLDGEVREVWDDILVLSSTDIAAILSESELVAGTVGNGGGDVTVPQARAPLVGGLDGIAGVDKDDYIGTTGAVTTGLQLLRAVSASDIDLLVCPNTQAMDAEVYAEMIDVAESRQDMISILDNPNSFIVTEAGGTVGIDEFWRGAGAHAEKYNANSSFAANYFPWIEVRDHYNDVDLELPPGPACAGAITYSDYASYPWWAPAGMDRGLLSPLVTDLAYHMLDSELDTMQSDTTKGGSNPLLVIDNEYYVMGQKTMLRSNSMLNRINTRRMVNKLKKTLTEKLSFIQWQPNDEYTWRQAIALCTPQLTYLVSTRGLTSFDVECGLGVTMTADEIAQGKLIIRIVLYLMPTGEKIVFNYVITSQDASFSELGSY